MRTTAFSILLLLIIAARPAFAWEAEAGAVFPALNGFLPAGVAINGVQVRLSADGVAIRYAVRNEAARSQAFSLSSYLPPFGWQGTAAEYNDLSFPEAALSLDGKVLKPQEATRALIDGVDAVDSLRSAGVDPRLVAQTEAVVAELELHGKAAKLRKRGAFRTEGVLLLPNWLLQVNRSWSPTILSRSDSVLTVQYQPMPAFRSVRVGSNDWLALLYQHCADPEAVVGELGRIEAAPVEYRTVRIYSIPVAIANVLSIDPDLSVDLRSSHENDERAKLTLTCKAYGGEGLTGSPSIATTRVIDTAVLSILFIF